MQKSYIVKASSYTIVFIFIIALFLYFLLKLPIYDLVTVCVLIAIGSAISMWFNFKTINEIMEDRYRKKRRFKNKMESKIKIKNRQRNDMISAIAHEFRNPISVIMGYAQTLTDDPNIDTNLRIKFLSKIYDNSHKIEAVLARLILWNKFESKSAKLDISTFSLHELATEIVLTLKEKYINRNIKINSDNSIVEADRLLIGMVMHNIIENALKYSKDDVIVDIKDMTVKTSDSGVGISSDDIASITKKFYRSGTHDWDNSMGIGLSIVKQILKLHNSELIISSIEGSGSSFSFVLKNKMVSNEFEI